MVRLKNFKSLGFACAYLYIYWTRVSGYMCMRAFVFIINLFFPWLLPVVGRLPSTDENESMMIVKGFTHDVLQDVEQHGWLLTSRDRKLPLLFCNYCTVCCLTFFEEWGMTSDFINSLGHSVHRLSTSVRRLRSFDDLSRWGSLEVGRADIFLVTLCHSHL